MLPIIFGKIILLMAESITFIPRLPDRPRVRYLSPEWNIRVPSADHLTMLSGAISSSILPLLNGSGFKHLKLQELSLNSTEKALASKIASGQQVSVLAILDLDGSILPHPFQPRSLPTLQRDYREGYRVIRGIAQAAKFSCAHTARFSVSNDQFPFGLPHRLARKFPFIDQGHLDEMTKLGDFETNGKIDHKLLVVSDKLSDDTGHFLKKLRESFPRIPDIIYSFGDTESDLEQARKIRDEFGVPVKHINMGNHPRRF